MTASCSHFSRLVVPHGTVWMLDPAHKSALGVKIEDRSNPYANSTTQSIDLMENYICFAPSTWEQIEVYLRQLQAKCE